MAPDKVNKTKETNLWWKMYWPKKPMIPGKRKQTRKPFKFKVGDRVRVTHIRNPFTRKYDQKWSGELFIIADRRLKGGIPVYRLKDYMDEDFIGTFYQPELQKMDTREDDAFKIETILKTKGRGRNKQYLVKWLYWSSKFNSWIKADSIE
ncbi:hypothetical protein FSP39_017779 [Pinctada imbricata]|uniref:Chromo domain-containing protein n=1 Tax=Pinctada imbricata TaxID=66713 RepID=A0AA89C1U1_PINIB|nr:hypothetical protein FSP39_017779 [Pinctada imbricata]